MAASGIDPKDPNVKFVFHTKVHPEREKEFRSTAPPKSMIKEGKKEVFLGCTKCGRLNNDEVELKKCIGCKLVFYCSKTCQKADWPTHKAHCSKADDLGPGIQPLIQYVTGNPMLSHYIQVCLAFRFHLNKFEKFTAQERRTVIRAPLLAHIDVGIEPTQITQFMELYTYPDTCDLYLDGSEVEGMLQFHDLVSPWPGVAEGKRPVTEQNIELWKRARQLADEDDEEMCPVVLVQFVNNFHQSITVPITVGLEAIGSARRAVPFTMVSALTGKEMDKPLNVATCFEYMNTQIRADKKNRFCLRAPMREVDMELIRDASRNVQSHAPQALRLKMKREHVYISHPASIFEETAGGISSTSARALESVPLGDGRQIEGGSSSRTDDADPNAKEDLEVEGVRQQLEQLGEPPKMNRAERRRLQRESEKQKKKKR